MESGAYKVPEVMTQAWARTVFVRDRLAEQRRRMDSNRDTELRAGLALESAAGD